MKKCYVFNGAGGYIAWYLGYAKFLQETSTLSDDYFAGTSAGSIVAVFLACEIPMKEVWDKWLVPAMEDFPSKSALKRHAMTIISKEAFSKGKDRLFVSMTNVYMERISENYFATNEALIECIMASCHVPLIIDGNATCRYKDNDYLDGGVYNMVGRGEPFAPCDEPVDYVRIQTPYRNYEQIAALSRFGDMSFHLQNYMDGYRFAKDHILPS